MPTTITWEIDALDAYPQHDGKQNVVSTAHWRVNGSDGDYTASVYGSTGLTYDDSAPFTPFDNLTKDQVIVWVRNTLGSDAVNNIEDSVSAQIEEQKSPSVVKPHLPW